MGIPPEPLAPKTSYGMTTPPEPPPPAAGPFPPASEVKRVYRHRGFGLVEYFYATPSEMRDWRRRSKWDRFWNRKDAPWNK